MTITIPKITTARARALIAAATVIATGALIGALAGSGPRPTAAAARRDPKPAVTAAALSTAHGAKICRDLNGWLAGASGQTKPRFTSQLDFDEEEAGYTALGNDLMTLDWNLINFNSGALKNSAPNYYPVTGLAALQHDCATYGVTLNTASG